MNAGSSNVVHLFDRRVEKIYRDWVVLVCYLADALDAADGYIQRQTPKRRIIFDLRPRFLGRRTSDHAAQYIASLMGPHPSMRHSLTRREWSAVKSRR